MGTLRYDGVLVEFDDRLLAHLHIVIVRKLRHNEGFTMSWLNSLNAGDGRSSIWLDRSIPLYFRFNGSRMPSINPEWIEHLDRSAASSSGLIVVDEDGHHARSSGTISTA